MPTTIPTPYPCEWFRCKDGVQHYWTEDEIALVEERIAKAPARLQDPLAGIGTRKHARLSPVPMDARPAPKKSPPKPSTPDFTPVVCGYCGEVFMSRATGKPRSYCSNSCRAKGNHRKARGVLPIRPDARKAS